MSIKYTIDKNGVDFERIFSSEDFFSYEVEVALDIIRDKYLWEDSPDRKDMMEILISLQNSYKIKELKGKISYL